MSDDLLRLPGHLRSYGAIVRAFRDGARLSVVDAAAAAGMSTENYERLEAGYAMLPPEDGERIGRLLALAAETKRRDYERDLMARTKQSVLAALQRSVSLWEQLADGYEVGAIGHPLASLEALKIDPKDAGDLPALARLALEEFGSKASELHVTHLRMRARAVRLAMGTVETLFGVKP